MNTNLPKEGKDSKYLYYSLKLEKNTLNKKKNVEISNTTWPLFFATSYIKFRLLFYYSATVYSGTSAEVSMVSGVYHLLHICKEYINFRVQFSADNCLSFII